MKDVGVGPQFRVPFQGMRKAGGEVNQLDDFWLKQSEEEDVSKWGLEVQRDESDTVTDRKPEEAK